MASQILPLTNAPDQTMSVSLTVDGAPLTLGLRIRFSEIAGYWVLTIKDRRGGLLVDSVPLLTGYYPAANLLQQQAYLGIGSAYLLNVSGTDADHPDATNLGRDFLLLWDDTPTY